MANNPKPITIRGTTYPSRRAAANALGITTSSLYEAIRKGRIDCPNLGRLAHPPTPTRVLGRDFPTRKAAADWLGVTPTQLANYFLIKSILEDAQK